MSKQLPSWAELGRQGWAHRGQTRPPFAQPPGPGQESVWDYPRPPRIVSDPREVVVRVGEVEIARTRRALRVLETSHPPTFYLPRADVAMPHLAAAGRGSRCEWKGEASYYDVVVAGERRPRAAWSYEQPFDDAVALAGHLAFYASLVEATVAGERVRPQPGGFYGGW
ncbi:MAG: DUF427 domain-containing protein, partial [Myxococcales bacterium]|nr:DUF427 domain-containing protein [Myxococcales bacterium]